MTDVDVVPTVIHPIKVKIKDFMNNTITTVDDFVDDLSGYNKILQFFGGDYKIFLMVFVIFLVIIGAYRYEVRKNSREED